MSRTRVRRRRVTMTVAVVVLAAVLSGPVASAVSGPDMVPAGRRTYVVKVDDTLWAIAARVAPGQDPRPWIQRIQEANRVDAGALRPGQILVIPAVR